MYDTACLFNIKGVDRINLIYSYFLKVARNYTLPHYDYEPPLSDTVFDFATTVGDKASNLADRVVASASGSRSGGLNSPATALETAPSLSHAFARAANQSCDLVSPEEPLHAGLKKFAVAQERMGNLRLAQDGDAKLKFYGPFLSFMHSTIESIVVLFSAGGVNGRSLEFIFRMM
jgi:hypothetical protein